VSNSKPIAIVIIVPARLDLRARWTRINISLAQESIIRVLSALAPMKKNACIYIFAENRMRYSQLRHTLEALKVSLSVTSRPWLIFVLPFSFLR